MNPIAPHNPPIQGSPGQLPSGRGGGKDATSFDDFLADGPTKGVPSPIDDHSPPPNLDDPAADDLSAPPLPRPMRWKGSKGPATDAPGADAGTGVPLLPAQADLRAMTPILTLSGDWARPVVTPENAEGTTVDAGSGQGGTSADSSVGVSGGGSADGHLPPLHPLMTNETASGPTGLPPIATAEGSSPALLSSQDDRSAGQPTPSSQPSADTTISSSLVSSATMVRLSAADLVTTISADPSVEPTGGSFSTDAQVSPAPSSAASAVADPGQATLAPDTLSSLLPQAYQVSINQTTLRPILAADTTPVLGSQTTLRPMPAADMTMAQDLSPEAAEVLSKEAAALPVPAATELSAPPAPPATPTVFSTTAISNPVPPTGPDLIKVIPGTVAPPSVVTVRSGTPPLSVSATDQRTEVATSFRTGEAKIAATDRRDTPATRESRFIESQASAVETLTQLDASSGTPVAKEANVVNATLNNNETEPETSPLPRRGGVAGGVSPFGRAANNAGQGREMPLGIAVSGPADTGATASQIAGTPAPEPTAARQAVKVETLLQNALTAGEGLRPGGHEQMEMKVRLGGGSEDVTVRLQVANDRMQVTFQTNSPEMRKALEHGWEQFSTSTAQTSTLALDHPRFETSPANAISQGLQADTQTFSSNQQNSRRQETPASSFEDGTSFAGTTRAAVSSQPTTTTPAQSTGRRWTGWA